MAGSKRSFEITDLKRRLESGEKVVAFELPVAERRIRWPKSLGGYAMKTGDERREWIVSLNYPSGSAIWQMANGVLSRGTAKPLKESLAAAGAA